MPGRVRHDRIMTNVGVVGLGMMGGRIARRFVDEGHDVTVWNRTPEKAAPLVAAGAAVAESPAAVATSSDAVVTMLADPSALFEVVNGPDGLADAGDPFTLIEMSTVGPATIEQLAEALPSHVELMDAPVLGSTSEVEERRLKVFAGGAVDAVARWRALLEGLGTVIHVGPLGSGAAAKLVANSTLLAALTAVGEAVALGRRLGVDDDALFEVLSATPLAAQAERRRASIENDDYPLRFHLALAHKDADLVTGAAADVGLEAHVAAAARRWFISAESAGLGDEDYSAILRYILDSTTGDESS